MSNYRHIILKAYTGMVKAEGGRVISVYVAFSSSGRLRRVDPDRVMPCMGRVIQTDEACRRREGRQAVAGQAWRAKRAGRGGEATFANTGRRSTSTLDPCSWHIVRLSRSTMSTLEQGHVVCTLQVGYTRLGTIKQRREIHVAMLGEIWYSISGGIGTLTD